MLNGLAGWKREAQRSCWVCKLRMEMERGNECVNDGEEIGRVGWRCNAMRMDFERKNGNGMCE